MSSSVLKVYFAGPDVFKPDAVEIGVKYVALAKQLGLEGLYPMDNQVDMTSPTAASDIFHGNMAMLTSANFIVANLEPFRGPEPDSGTVWECAHGYTKGIPVFGYCQGDASMADRVRRYGPVVCRNGLFFDKDNLLIEDFGSPVNLMISQSLELLVIGTVEDALKAAISWYAVTR